MITSDFRPHIFIISLIWLCLSLFSLFPRPAGNSNTVNVSKLITDNFSFWTKVFITFWLPFCFLSFFWRSLMDYWFKWRLLLEEEKKRGEGAGKKEKRRRTGQRKGDVSLSSHDLQRWLGTIMSSTAAWTIKLLRQKDRGGTDMRIYQGVVISRCP